MATAAIRSRCIVGIESLAISPNPLPFGWIFFERGAVLLACGRRTETFAHGRCWRGFTAFGGFETLCGVGSDKILVLIGFYA